MQALSIWPLRHGFFVVPKLEFEVSSSRISHRRRKKMSDFEAASPSKTCVSVRKCEFLLPKYYNFKVLFNKPTRGGFAAPIGFNQQEIGSESVSEEPNDYDNQEVGRGEHIDDGRGRAAIRYVENNDVNTRIDVRQLAYNLQFAKTADDIEDVLKDKGELPLQVYSAMIRGFGKEKKVGCAMALVDWLKRKKDETGGRIGPNLFIYNSLLGALKQSEQFGMTESILDRMEEEGVAPNVVTYNTLMAIYLEQGKSEKALSVLDEIINKGFSPSPVSYSTALLVYRRIEDGFGALKFFVKIREKYSRGEIGTETDEDWENEFAKLENFIIRICYQVMRRWLVSNRDLRTDVLNLLAEMDTAGLHPGRAEHERLIWACTREEHYVVGKELYKRIREQNPDISISVCNHLIWLMGKAKKWWAALEVYEDLLDKGPKPNNMSYELIMSHFNILLTAASKRGIWRWGIRLLNKMEEKGIKPGSRQWNAVLVACSKSSETSAAVEIFKRMIEQGEKPTIISYGALLSALEKGKLYDEARRVWEHMLRIGVKPNLYAYTIMVSVFTGQGKFNLVDAIFQEMAKTGVEPTVVTYNAIISGCARNSMSSAAYEWFHLMKTKDIEPNEISYEMLIEALANDGKPRLAYELYLKAQDDGLCLSSKAYDAVVRSSHENKATIDLNVLGTRPPDKIRRVQTRKVLSEFCNMADVPRRNKPFDRNEIYIQ